MRQSLVASLFGPARSRQRAAAVLFAAAAIGAVSPGLMPHVVYRVPLALVAAAGLWMRRRWAFPVALIAAMVWMLITLPILLFVLGDAGPPWELGLARVWLYWGVPAALVLWAVVLLVSRGGREERRLARSPSS